MGDEVEVSGCLVSVGGDAFPLGGLNGVEFEGDDAVAPCESLSATFSMTVESFSDLVNAIAGTGRRVRSFVVEMDRSVRKSFPGPSRFMRSRRMWQCRRGGRNANVERRKLARKKSHLEKVRNRIVFPSAAVYGNYETNEVVFEIDGGAGA